MARRITRAPDFQSSAEERTFDALVAGLPDDWGVAHGVAWTVLDQERRQRSSEADVVVVAPEGVCTIEVKGGTISRRGTNWYSTDSSGKSHKIRDPARQTRTSSKTLLRKVQSMGINGGEFAHAVVFPDCVADVAELGMDLDGGVLVDGEALGDIGTHIKSLLRPEGARPRFKSAEIERISSLLEPDWSLGGDLGLEIGRVGETAARLSDEQHQTLKGLAGIARVAVRGGSGTGKSVLALRSAADMAAQGSQVLYVCYNRPLAEAQAQAAGAIPRLRVSTFHELCHRWATAAGLPTGGPSRRSDRTATSAYFDDLVRSVIDAMAIPPDERYDAIVVDEGQDFRSEWLTLLECALADTGTSRFHVFLDEAQRIYNADAEPPDFEGFVPWSLSGQLRTGCILARSIAELLGDPEPDCRLDGGAPLERIEVGSADEVPKALGRLLSELLGKRGVNHADLVVQTGVAGPRSSVWGRRLGNVTLAGRDPDSHEAPPPLHHDEVRVETIHRFKGLEAPATILVEVYPSTKADLRALVRIGLTRAQTYAAIILTPDAREALESP